MLLQASRKASLSNKLSCSFDSTYILAPTAAAKCDLGHPECSSLFSRTATRNKSYAGTWRSTYVDSMSENSAVLGLLLTCIRRRTESTDQMPLNIRMQLDAGAHRSAVLFIFDSWLDWKPEATITCRSNLPTSYGPWSIYWYICRYT